MGGRRRPLFRVRRCVRACGVGQPVLSGLDKAGEAFERHGRKAILIGSLISSMGAPIPVPAGLERTPVRWRFPVYTVPGGTPWTGTLVGSGWAPGGRWRTAGSYASFIGFAVPVAPVLGIPWLLWRRWQAQP